MERCDACGVEAQVEWEHETLGRFLFCGHHGHALRDVLIEKGWWAVGALVS